ncbi:hypothetical protein YA0002_22550 [Pseudomonas cichorii]|uniref:hypothetical protein n=1 Tax=Pseudomonas cichorii TaxID=36746 RepID=UPI0018E60779|nr:hypothetical protein [Pseudomonas cichorii]MBI6855547.1 hypothetical protein [Pseudomonas cichorii]
MRAMDALTQSLIDHLTQLLHSPQEDSLATLQICAPVLIENLRIVKDSAVDRREIIPQLRKAVDKWLAQHPQPDTAQQDLLVVLERELLGKSTS